MKRNACNSKETEISLIKNRNIFRHNAPIARGDFHYATRHCSQQLFPKPFATFPASNRNSLNIIGWITTY